MATSREPLDAATLQALDAAHFLHPFSDSKSIGTKGTRVIVRGEGVYLYEASGHRLLDGMSGLWCVAIGYGRAELAEAGFPLLQSEMTNRVVYAEAALWGATPSLIDPTGPAARDIAAIANEVDGILGIKQAA